MTAGRRDFLLNTRRVLYAHATFPTSFPLPASISQDGSIGIGSPLPGHSLASAFSGISITSF